MPNSSARTARIVAILSLAALPRIWAAVWDQGLFWPDEIFQSLEPAHHFAFGYGFVAWEFQDGARSWLFPGTFGLLWKLLALLGVHGAPTLVIAAKLAMVAVALVGVYASIRLGEKLGGAEAGVLCGVLAAVFPPSIVYGSRCMTEMGSGPLCLIAVLLSFGASRRKLALAGALAGLALFLRYQNGIVVVGLLGWLLARRRGRDALAYTAGAVVAVLAGGLLDLVTWGAPFHSFVTYVRFNLIEGHAADFGIMPFYYYGVIFCSAVGVSILAVAVGLWESARRATALLVIVVLYVLAHSLVDHKEFRFMMPIVPLMLTLSGVGLARFIGRFPAKARPRRTVDVRKTIWVVAGLLVAAMGWQTAHVSFDDFGQQYGPLSGPGPLWHKGEAVNRLLWTAGEQADLRGLELLGYGPIWTGGFSYLHRDVPVLWERNIEYALAQPALGALGASANYVLAPAETRLPPEYTTVQTIGDAKLARRSGPCAAPPPGYSRLFSLK